MSSVSPVISAVGLTKVFRDFWQRARVWAVRDLDLEVHPGEIFGLLGPNGSGKSTAIKMILGLLFPTRGRVSVFGRPPDDVQIKTRIGYLPEESYLYRFLNARETLDYYGTLFQLPRAQRRRRTEELLEMVGLRGAARRPVGEYSKGMARRIGLAQALINDPDLLILDEPTSGLDPIGAQLVKDIIVRLGQAKRKTILLSSHLLADVEEVCGRMAILYGGRIQVTGRMDEVLARSDMIQITCAHVPQETLSQVTELIRKRVGTAPTVAPARDRLSELFLRIVREANARREETGGAAAGGAIAEFLGEPATAAETLQSLLQPVSQPAAARAPQPAAAQVNRAVLGDLTAPQAPAAAPPNPSAPAPAAPPAPVDSDLLADLTGQRQEPPSQ
jgi:ABC-2 type transport system ATP-binding protein